MARSRSPFSVSAGGASSSARAWLGVAERRCRALAELRRRPLHAAHRVVGDGVLFAEIIIERGQRRELAAHGGAGQRPDFQGAAPGDDMGPGDLAQFGDGADADEAAELADIALIGAPRVRIADVGGPFDFRGDVGETLELHGGQPPALAVAAVPIPLGARLGARTPRLSAPGPWRSPMFMFGCQMIMYFIIHRWTRQTPRLALSRR